MSSFHQETMKEQAGTVTLIAIVMMIGVYMITNQFAVSHLDLSHKVGHLSDTVQQLSDTVAQLVGIVDKHGQTAGKFGEDLIVLKGDVGTLKDTMTQYIEGQRDRDQFSNQRAAVLARVTSAVVICGHPSTGFAMSWNGGMTTVSIAHAYCNGTAPPDRLACPDLDISISTTCPTTSSALDVVLSTPAVSLGDRVVAVGIVKGGLLSWTGTVAGWLTEPNACPHHWAMCSKASSSHLLVHGDQIGGMSGALELGRAGPVGVAIATLASEFHPSVRDRRAVVVPWVEVLGCLDHFKSKLKKAKDCTEVKTIGAPVLLRARAELPRNYLFGAVAL